VKVSLHLTRFNWPEGDASIGRNVEAIAQRAEAAGFDGLWPVTRNGIWRGSGSALWRVGVTMSVRWGPVFSDKGHCRWVESPS
jgi:alkanesulfonate monooxygenase SsuD/methylene tetrahydromethanopterin reductase-like flavin-dependent oxidoreductase (luciferase family)